MAVFISEWGDLTQITTANLAASNGAWSTAIGSAAALMSVSRWRCWPAGSSRSAYR